MGKRKASMIEEEDKGGEEEVPFENIGDEEKDSSSQQQQVVKRRKFDLEPREWISATSTRNYMIDDPILDFLSLHAKNFRFSSNVHNNTRTSQKERFDFTNFIMKQGNRFERCVINDLYKRFRGNNEIIDIGGELGPHKFERYEATLKAMSKGVPIIYSGVVRDNKRKTFGIPDLIVREDWINKIVNKKHVIDPDKTKYRIVDIKFSTLDLRADDTHLLNKTSVKAFKGQLWVYVNALAEMQDGYNPGTAYLLGRRWKSTCLGEAEHGDGCFELLGEVNFNLMDKPYANKAEDALAWIKRLRSEGERWDPFVSPNPIPELYPNMSNRCDYPFTKLKLEIANKIDEISSVWMCGKKHRETAHSQKIYRWTDPRCTAKALGFDDNSPKYKIIDAILDINRKKDPVLLPEKIKMPLNEDFIRNQRPLEFYVDFETINDIVSGFSEMPKTPHFDIIFMIGVGYYSTTSNKWRYKSFIIDDFSLEEEKRICKEFCVFIDDKTKKYGMDANDPPKLIHWSFAEPNFWRKAMLRHNKNASLSTRLDYRNSSLLKNCKLEWYDLMDVFKREPIVVRGCLNYSLKSIAKAMHSHDLIETCWDDNSVCFDGMSAMVSAVEAGMIADERGLRMADVPLMKEIEKYNEVDCKVMYEIVDYLRQFH